MGNKRARAQSRAHNGFGLRGAYRHDGHRDDGYLPKVSGCPDLTARAQPPKGGERSDHKHRDPKSAIPSSSRSLETQPSKAREARTFLF